MKITTMEQLNKTMNMPCWPSDKKYMYRGATGSNDLYYADIPASFQDDYITSKSAFLTHNTKQDYNDAKQES